MNQQIEELNQEVIKANIIYNGAKKKLDEVNNAQCEANKSCSNAGDNLRQARKALHVALKLREIAATGETTL